ncbi:MAG: hypothetical protein QNK29_06730 [Desulfobacterales bacterium]|nr:hypothetical protein [Desulfobacterales bacterium]
MKAGIFFTGTGPILLLTTYGELNDPTLVTKLAKKGLRNTSPMRCPKIW